MTNEITSLDDYIDSRDVIARIAQLIRESYFTEAMRELVSDIGDLPKDVPGYLVIDWEATAENLKVDYTAVDFDGVTYYVR